MGAEASIVVADSKGAAVELLREAMGGSVGVLRAEDASKALELLESHAAELLLIDGSLGQAESFSLLRAAQQRWSGVPVILLGEELTLARVAEAVEVGAADLLMVPVVPAQLAFSINKALAAGRRTAFAPPPPARESGLVLGRSPAMKAVEQVIQKVAPTSSTILIRGESGTGKELVARALHGLSTRAQKPLIKIDCTSLPENLIESELFGFEKGAFTGATAPKAGRIELAEGGTLFLDEIGELPLPTQAKLLRVLQDREFERVGAIKTLSIDVRVVAATHRDLEAMVKQGTFREDLFYRLNVVPVWIAPLRARRMDIEELVRHFCARAAASAGKATPVFERAALDVLASQRWPGNVRQLENFVERLVVLTSGPRISEAEVTAELKRPVRFVTQSGPAGGDASGDASNDSTGVEPLPLSEALRAAERESLRRALRYAEGSRAVAARLLGVSRSTLYSKLQEYALL